MPAGRPLKFETVKILDGKIQAYFDEVAANAITLEDGRVIQEPLTITGLALALDTTRQTLMDYEERDEFTYTVKRAKTIVENFAEKRLFGSNATGAIFALKNYGWKDKSEQENLNTNLNKDVDTDSDLDKEILDRYFQKKGKE